MSHDELRSVLELEPDTQDKVSFNYPKYRDKGVSHEIWMRNVNLVEVGLEEILSEAPLGDEFPVMHIRNEELDEDDQVIRVHLEVYGKASIVNQGIAIFNNTAVQKYVASNILNSTEAETLLSKLPPQVLSIAEAIKNGEPTLGLEGSVTAVPLTSTNNIKEQVIAHLEKMGVDTSGVEIDGSTLIDSDGSLKDLGPLDLSLVDEEGATDEPLDYKIPFLLPNPDPDEFN